MKEGISNCPGWDPRVPAPNLVDVLWKSSGLHSLVQGLVLVCRRRDAPDFAATAELLCPGLYGKA